jgi:hypothetical protein
VADRGRIVAQAERRGCVVASDSVTVCGTRFGLATTR